ncbi:MAG: stage V sporulation protein AA [Lachnospiraceae bacterium]|nr:stage V sporulation protein AA [Lachnospiraceae bacterium]
MSDILYLKIAKNIEVCQKDIFLSDVASMECTNRDILNKVKAIRLLKIPDQKNNRYVFSILKVIEEIHKICPQLEIQNLGEIDFIIDYEAPRKQSPFIQWGKFLFICLVTFFGAGFSILTFHNDVGVNTIFAELYRKVMGEEAAGYTILEISYSVGLVLGILLFYNHFGGKKVTTDPTPVEVEMRLYEDDINQTLIEGVNRKDKHIEVQ